MDASMPPQEVAMSPLMKAEFEEWGTKTTAGVLAGMMYVGLREPAASALWDDGVNIFESSYMGWVQSSLQEELAQLKEQEEMQAQMAEAQRQKLILGDGEAVDAVTRRLEGRVPDQAAKPD